MNIDLSSSANSAEKNKEWMKKHPIWTTVIVLFLIGLIVDIFDGPTPSAVPAQTPSEEPEKVQEQAQEAKNDPDAIKKATEELEAFMAVSKEAQIVSSYEFSDTAVIVYVDRGWYGQTVQFKKDFIAKVGMLKKAVTGYTHYELHDAYSNEKVGEITAFSQSIEVYK